MRTLVVAGTRPEVIKLAPVVWALERSGGPEAFRFVLSGQHGEHAQELCAELGVRVDADLATDAKVSAGDLLGRLVASLDAEIAATSPDAIVVQGDTATTLAGALAGYYRRVPVAHVEAGLRTGDLYKPYPEEGNRRLVAAVASLNLAPTAPAAGRLLAEGIDPSCVVVVGNTVVDAVRTVAADCPPAADERPYALVTMHRREHWGGAFDELCEGVAAVLDAHPELDARFVMHMNPVLQDRVRAHFGSRERVTLLEPTGYRRFVELLGGARLILSDSGGIQEEAVALGKPVVVLRESTERGEGVEHGAAVLAGIERAGVMRAAETALAHAGAIDRDLYGDGTSGARIVRELEARYGA
jgi:UDP-N-acetylglucosamine 2-epimerase (non-hydrolysing)